MTTVSALDAAAGNVLTALALAFAPAHNFRGEVDIGSMPEPRSTSGGQR